MRIRTRYWGLGGLLALAATLVLLVALPSSASDRAQHVRWDIISATGVPPGPLNPGGHASATAASGGPGVGQLDLKIMGMDFPGTVEHGQIRIGT